MLTTMATALLNAIPGESPETRLAAFAERLGAVYESSCWRMSPAVRETLRDAAVALAIEFPEPVDDAMDPGWEAVVLEAEARRQARTVERVTARFSRSCRGAGRQALFDGQGAMLAQLVAADLPVTPETLAWVASLEDLSVLPIETPVEYLSVDQLAQRIPYKTKTIRNMMCRGVFIEGVHFTRLTGRPIFLWSRVEKLLREGSNGRQGSGGAANE